MPEVALALKRAGDILQHVRYRPHVLRVYSRQGKKNLLHQHFSDKDMQSDLLRKSHSLSKRYIAICLRLVACNSTQTKLLSRLIPTLSPIHFVSSSPGPTVEQKLINMVVLNTSGYNHRPWTTFPTPSWPATPVNIGVSPRTLCTSE